MSDWPQKALAEVAKVGAGNPAPQNERLFHGGSYPFFRTADAGRVGVGTIRHSTDHLNEEGIKGLRRYPKGTILLPKSGASTFLNHRVMLGTDGFVASHLATVLADESKVHRGFLFHFLTTVRAQDLIPENKYPSLKLSDVRAIRVPIPPLAEQKRIAAVLDEVFDGIDGAIANTEQNLANATAVFHSHLNTIFDHRRQDWEARQLGELASIKHGFAFKSKYFAADGDYVLLTPGNFFEQGGYRDRGEKQKYYVGEIPPEYVLPKGALLVAMTEQAAGLLGSPAIVPDEDRFLHNQRLGLVEPLTGADWCTQFFFHAFNTEAFRQQVHREASGVKVRHTSPKKLAAVGVPVPRRLGEQYRVAAELDDLFCQTTELGENAKQKIGALGELKQVILQKAFAGELIGKVAETEIAAV